jgi:hypothetical protein
MTKHESIFISHDSVEAAAAAAIRSALTELGLHAFVASENLQPGSRWEESIRGALRDCTACLVLCSERSLASEWVWMEFGAATVVAPDRVVPVLLPGLDRDRVPSQFRPYQYIVLDAPEGCQELVFSCSLPSVFPCGLIGWKKKRLVAIRRLRAWAEPGRRAPLR